MSGSLPEAGFLHLIILTFGADAPPLWGLAILCIEGCLAASLASAH